MRSLDGGRPGMPRFSDAAGSVEGKQAMKRRTFLVGSAAAAVLSSLRPVMAFAATATGRIGAWGFDLTGRDLAVKPGDDFFRHSGGTWLKTTEIPADRSRWGSFDMLAEEAEVNVRAIIAELVATGGKTENERKIVALYTSFLDTAAIDAAGLAPLAPALAEIAALTTHEDIARWCGVPGQPATLPIGVGIGLDAKNPDRYVPLVGQSGLGLPDRDYYLDPGEKYAGYRAKYLAHVAAMLTLAGQPQADSQAEAIVAFELEIAKLHWERAKLRDRDRTYNLRAREDLSKEAGDFPWAAYLESAGLDATPDFIVRQTDAVPALATLFSRTPVETLKSYLTYHLLRQTAAVLPTPFDDEEFAFFGRTLNGQPEKRAREKRATQAVNAALGEAVGELYVARHFPPESRAKVLELVESVRRAYARRIDALSWMTDETKAVAREKLSAFNVKMGYPDTWRDYSALAVQSGDALGNLLRARAFERRRDVARLGKPSDRGEWGMTPQTVNAYYNSAFNEIVFPAAILQPPFFDPEADPAVNYGGIGGVIGHEMGHGFDDQGAKSDAKGILRTWWNERDTAAFKLLGDKLVAQYSAYEPLPGERLDGRLGLGENIGDNGGLQVAYEAYRVTYPDAPVLDGLTGDQRFFHGWAQVWRGLYREARLRQQIVTGPHSPPEFRVNGVVRNIDGWYAAFDVKPGDKLYLAPEERVLIW